ncbi:hypothetical protein [Reichenbachiella sp. MALMAid0571]|uniref:hypothetical protein n=1 Tax=Reichenbachiella sp. MALMAid0571 TaxID=3143939 RepID=UPI0032DF32BA
MKTIKNVILFSTCLLYFAACKDDENLTSVISNEEAVEIVAASLADESYGATSSMTTSAVLAKDVEDTESGGRTTSCGFSKDSTFVKTNIDGALITYDYSFSYSYEVVCTNLNTPSYIGFTIGYEGDYESTRFSSSNTGSATWKLSGLELSESKYVLNGSYTRDGSFQSKVRNQNATNSNLEFILTDLMINKSTYEIESGTATVNISGELEGKGSFGFTSTVVYLGNSEASVTISGETYIINLESGEIVQG